VDVEQRELPERPVVVTRVELGAALETWREITFEFDTVDTLDPSHA
jgi:hypothetical protein